MTSERRRWVPDPNVMADEIIACYRDAEDEHEGNEAVLSTVTSWHVMAQAHDGEWLKEDDWIVLVQELARRIAGQ